MDVNGLPFRLLAGAADFGFGAAARGDGIARGLIELGPEIRVADQCFDDGAMLASPALIAG